MTARGLAYAARRSPGAAAWRWRSAPVRQPALDGERHRRRRAAGFAAHCEIAAERGAQEQTAARLGEIAGQLHVVDRIAWALVGDLEDRDRSVPAQAHVDRTGRVAGDVAEQLAEDQLRAVDVRARVDLRRQIALKDRARIVRQRRIGDAECESGAVGLERPPIRHDVLRYPFRTLRSR